MTQTRKGKVWHFGMKAHIGVDADSGLVHTVIAATEKLADMSKFEAYQHGEEARASADRGYDCSRLRQHLANDGIEDWIALKKKPGHPVSE